MIEHWMSFLQDSGLNLQASLHHLRLFFCWSRMARVDDMHDYQRSLGLTFHDFLEAFCRIAHSSHDLVRTDPL